MGKLLFTLIVVFVVGSVVSNCIDKREAQRAAADKAAAAATLAAADARAGTNSTEKRAPLNAKFC